MSFVQELFFKEKTPGRELLDSIAGGCQEIYASGVKAGAASFFASHVFDRLERHCVLVAASYDEAQEYYDELQFFRSMQQAPGDDAPDVLLFPPLETQPYENVLSHCDISSQRLWTLYRLCDTARPALVVTTVQALLQRLLPGSVLIDSCRTVTCGDEIDRDRLCEDLVACGYARVSMVEDRGDVSVRGEVLDLFPPGLDRPVRIDFFGDIVESIRLFDPATQRSCADLRAVELVPVREIILRDDVVQSCETRAAQASRAGLFATAKGRSFLDNIKNGFLPSGVEFALDVIYDEPETFFDYLPGEALFFWCDRKQTEAIVDSFVAEITRHYASASEERRVVSAPQDLYVGLDGFDGLPVPHQQVFFESFAVERRDTRLIKFNSRANDDIRQEMIACASQSGALGTLVERLEQWQANGIRTCIVCHTPSQCRRLDEMLQEYGLETSAAHERSFNEAVSTAGDGRIELLIGQLSRGFRYEDGLLVLITEEEIFGEKKRRRAAPRMKVGTAISDFSDLKEGDYVVHRDNGIGVYLGLETLDAGGLRADYLKLEYLGNDKLYLPVDRINLINKYETAEDSRPRIDKLGGTAWARVKKKVRESVEKIARDLLELYSSRKVYQGHAFAPPDRYYREFEASFPFEETPDQLAAIQDVMGGMSDPMPMDRLICGDVGYGKTEVALRAAFRAAMSGRQVAVLVPTTVLAQQHYQTFVERFKPYPVRVDIISRFRSPKDQKAIIADLAAGTVDIVIGTHRLVSKDVVFKTLGLLVIDEEHRFGVKHKEQVKKLKKTVDVLTLTATPIPRTLQFSMLGLRDFSTIETPPEDRLAIRTEITHFDEVVIRDAILRELKRGGQVFFVHDRVRSIHAMADFLHRLVPEASLGIAHGQMKEHELEKAMMQFVRKEIDVLLCTTIIESGLDFPTANTIIINNAHRLGLAQMYQLKGRVGRGKVRAYAYLLVPGKSILGRDAVKRLEAISEFTELGAGYRLATRDLQIRGAGNLLGHAQSGKIDAVGMDMYLELLSEAMTELKGEKVPPKIDPEVNLNIPACIPEEYVADINQRLVLYRRMASITSDEEVEDMEAELNDRFGRLPEQVATLLEVARIKNLLRGFLVVSVDFAQRQLVFSFHEEAEQSLERILALVASDQQRFRFTPDLKLFANVKGDGGEGLLQEIGEMLG